MSEKTNLVNYYAIIFSGNTQNYGLILLTRYASALRLMLCASHYVVLHTTLVEQSFSARLQAGLADSLCVDYTAQVTTPWLV